MKPSFYTSLILSLFVITVATAQEETAAQWAEKQKDALATLSATSLAETLKQGSPAFAALFAEIKTGGTSDALASTRIAALTQYVMMPGRNAVRTLYAEALLAAAQRATEADVVCFFLNQLRWCGLPHQAAAIKAFETSTATGVADLAAMTVQAVTDDRSSKAAPVQDTRNAAFNKELAALKPKARTPRLLQAFDDPDAAFAGVALAWARTTGGKKDTALWTAKLPTVADPVRKIMLLDMLAARGDKTACDAVAASLMDADDSVAATAQHALIMIDARAFADRLPALLKDLPPARLALVRDNIRQLTTGLIKKPLVTSFDTFSETGKRVALEVLKDRRVTDALEIGLASIAAKDEETVIAGYRLLREIAGKDQADVLVTRLLATSGRVTPEAQTTLSAAARRNAATYTAALAKALQTVPDTQQPIVLETAARLGGATLLKAVEAATASPNAETATAAVRALASWSDDASVPALLRLAATATNAKHQTLALRGLAKKLEADGADKTAAFAIWQEIQKSPVSDVRKKAIDDLFKKEVNVALGKTVTTDVPTEGDNVPANLTDGTLEKAWHGAQSPAHALIDLGAVQTLHAAQVTFYHDGRTYTFTLELSEDGKTWKQVASNTDAPKPATADGLRLEFAPTAARYARLTVLKNSANQAVHVLELKLFSAMLP